MRFLTITGLALLLAAPAMAQTADGSFRITVEGRFGSAEAARAAIAGATRGASYQVLSAGASQAEVSGGEAMLRALSASAAFTRVTSDAPVQRKRVGVLAVRATAAGWTAQWIEAAPAAGDAPAATPAGGSGLYAEIVDGSGRTVGGAMFEDPRLVRYEGVGPDGHLLVERRDFTAGEGVAYLTLPVPDAASTLRVSKAAPAGRADVAAMQVAAAPQEKR